MWLKPFVARTLLVCGLALTVLVSAMAPHGPWSSTPPRPAIESIR